MTKPVQFAVVLVLAMLPERLSVAQVRTWVASNGIDSNPCTRSAPCRNFAAAIAAVAANGEVVALDSAGYGPVLVDKGVTLLAPEGVHAAIAPTAADAIRVDAVDATVIVRNLFLNGQGAEHGIMVVAASRLFVEASVISGFSSLGSFFDVPGEFLMTDTIVRNIGGNGIVINQGSVFLDRVEFDGNFRGISVSGSRMFLRDSVVSNSGDVGLVVFNFAFATVESSVAVGNAGPGFYTQSPMVLSRCSSVGNGVGISAVGGSASVFVSATVISGNVVGIQRLVSGAVLSRGNNILRDNGNNGSFSGTFTAN